MEIRILKLFISICISVLLLSGCGCADSVSDNSAEDSSAAGAENIDDDDEGQEEYGIGNSGMIQRSDADALVEEALLGTGCTFSAAERIEATENNEELSKYEDYFVYTVASGNDILDQQLIVNPENGKLYVYDPLKEAVTEFSSFEKYKPENDSNIDWTGVYGKDGLELIIEEDEPGRFSYAIYKGDEQLHQGFAQEENHVKAVNRDYEAGEIWLLLSGDKITIETEDKAFLYAGVYVME